MHSHSATSFQTNVLSLSWTLICLALVYKHFHFTASTQTLELSPSWTPPLPWALCYKHSQSTASFQTLVLSLFWTLRCLGPIVTCTRTLQYGTASFQTFLLSLFWTLLCLGLCYMPSNSKPLSRVWYSPYPGPSFAMGLCFKHWHSAAAFQTLILSLCWIFLCLDLVLMPSDSYASSGLLYSTYPGPACVLLLVLHALTLYSRSYYSYFLLN
jgi:hypothetical protein